MLPRNPTRASNLNVVEGSVSFMSNVFIEREKDEYVAIQKKQIIARGDTQAETAAKAHKISPDDPVLAERVRNTNRGSRDKWRRMY